MALRTLLPLLALVAGHGVNAVTYIQKSQYCVAACGMALNHVGFDGHKPAAFSFGSPIPCTDTHYIDSLFYCTSTYCTPEQAQSGLDYSNQTCHKTLKKRLPSYVDFAEHYPNGPPNTIKRVSEEDALKQNFKAPVVPNEAFWKLGLESIAAQNRASYYNWDFAWALYGYWGLVFIVGIATRMIQALRHSSTMPRSKLIKGESLGRNPNSVVSKVGRFLRRHLILPLTVGNRHEVPFSPPTRIEGILVALYIAMVFAFCFPGYHVFKGSLYIAVTKEQLGTYIANRCGVLAIANLPIVWVTATRNDPLQWLTGWSYATFSQFHRWTARTATLLAVVHGIVYSVTKGYEGSYNKLWQSQFFYCGAISVIAMSILVGTSFYFLRHRFYDLFLVTHFVFAMILLVCMFLHTRVEYGAFNGFLWPCVAIWCFDRLMRWMRILRLSFLPNVKGTKATATYNPGMDLVRVDVSDFFKTYAPPLGSYYYVYVPDRLQGYESHPFTLCSWNHAPPHLHTPYQTCPMHGPFDSDDGHRDSNETEDSIAGLKERPPLDDPIPDTRKTAEGKHSFLIRPKGGFTHHLGKKTSQCCPASAIKSIDIRVLIEGPYGDDFHMRQYSTVVLIVGGAGITAAISRLYDLLRSSGSPNRVHFVWTTQRADMVENVAAHELDGVLGNPRLQVDIYSKPNKESADVEGKDTKNLRYNLLSGRPDVEAILGEERNKCEGSMAVFCCGPTGLESRARNTVLKMMGEAGPHVAFYGERFGW